MNKRIHQIISVFALMLIVLTVRMAYIQLYNAPGSGSFLAKKALQYRSQDINGEEYYRGEILDKNMLSLTDSGVRPTLVVYPSSIKNISEAAKKLEPCINLAAKDIEKAIKRGLDNHGVRTPIILKVNLTEVEIELLKSINIIGISVIPIKSRYGPNALANHLVGHLNSISPERWLKLTQEKRTQETNPNLATAYKITDKIGVAGLEAKFEKVLRGSRPESYITAIADANGHILQGLGYKYSTEEADPWRNHLVLTIDKRFQSIVEEVMDKSFLKGAVVVIDVPSGDVLALASRPNFDQNSVGKYIDGVDEFIDRTERAAFYPGSVFKMVVAAAILEENLLQPDEVFTCTGSYVFSDGTEIKCLHTHEKVNLVDAICKSCNTTFVKLGLRLGNEKFLEYASKLGFSVGLNNNSPPALLGNASIGQQGVLVSPLQIANLYATIARNGYYQPWRIAAEIRNSQGDIVHEYSNNPPVQVISDTTCIILKDALVQAVNNGSGKSAWVQDKGTAGKTGTAQVNEKDKVIAWFAGFTPINNPRLAIAVMVEENNDGAQTGLRGGETAGPVFKEIAEKIMSIEE